MDYIPFMSQLSDQLQSTDHQELFQMISGFPSKLDDPLDYQIQLEENHGQVPPPTPSRDGPDLITHKRRQPILSSSSTAFRDDRENPNEKKKKKKVIHREIERERRKEMAALYANLRLLIPLEHLKGKRSISDQMYVAINYIKELQRKNQELCGKRDELKKLCNYNSRSRSSGCNTSIDEGRNSKPYNSGSTISVRDSRAGIEVVVNTAFKQGLPLARLLQALAGEGLDVISCVSARVNERFLYTIESEVVTGKKSLDLSELEEKLRNLVV